MQLKTKMKTAAAECVLEFKIFNHIRLKVRLKKKTRDVFNRPNSITRLNNLSMTVPAALSHFKGIYRFLNKAMTTHLHYAKPAEITLKVI